MDGFEFYAGEAEGVGTVGGACGEDADFAAGAGGLYHGFPVVVLVELVDEPDVGEAVEVLKGLFKVLSGGEFNGALVVFGHGSLACGVVGVGLGTVEGADGIELHVWISLCLNTWA